MGYSSLLSFKNESLVLLVSMHIYHYSNFFAYRSASFLDTQFNVTWNPMVDSCYAYIHTNINGVALIHDVTRHIKANIVGTAGLRLHRNHLN